MIYTVYKDRRGGWRWRLVAGNGRKIANSGECYRRRIDCIKAVRLVQGTDARTPVRVP